MSNQPKRRYQKGSLVLKHGAWYARVESSPTANSESSPRKQSWVRLGSQQDWPDKADAQPAFQRFMLMLNDELGTTDSPLLLTFIEKTYLPSLRLAPSTIAGYHDCHKHIEDRLGDHTLVSLRPVDVRNLLQQIADEKDISSTTLKHIKHYLSGVFTWARNEGHFDGANPVQGVKLPANAREPEDTYAYTLQEEEQMTKALGRDLRSLTAIATASWSGVSMSELEGLCWQDRRDGHWFVSRSVVEGVIKKTKTKHRKAPVPIIPALAKVLNRYHKSVGSPASGWLFPSDNPDKPMRMMNLYHRHMQDVLEKAKITWHGWHAFRRGLASNLAELGTPDDVIQKILRHGDVQTTQRHYRKTRNPRVEAAMQQLEKTVGRRTRQTNGRHSGDKAKAASVSY